MFCKSCGKQLADHVRFCPYCGDAVVAAQTPAHVPAPAPEKAKANELRCLPSFILGVTGSTFGMLGGICTTMCSFGSGGSAFFFIFGGSIIGLIGACLCFKKAKIGSLLELLGALMIIYRAFFDGGSEFMSVFALILLLFGGLIGVVYSFLIKRK